MENFFDQILCVKVFLTVEHLLNQGKFPLPWKNPLIKKTFFDCEKLTYLTSKKDRSNNFETIKTVNKNNGGQNQYNTQ